LGVRIQLQGLPVGIACFGLDANGELSDERYMTFFNQRSTPCGGVTLTNPGPSGDTGFDLILDRLPNTIERLVFTAAIDGAGTMRDIRQGAVLIQDGATTKAFFDVSAAEFEQERAVMLIEIYRCDGDWRITATAQGFNGGLDALVEHLGGEVAIEPLPATAPPKISLEKKMQSAAPHLVDLAKKATVSLTKSGLQETIARVGLVIDGSGSMHHQYHSGRVQELLDRVLPLALHFDDDGELDVWVFADGVAQLKPIGPHNIRNYVDKEEGGWGAWMKRIAPCSNNEPAAMKAVIDFYCGDKMATGAPIYLIFVSDGGVSQSRLIQKIITEVAVKPIFWQFVGIGGRNYGALEKLDTLSGRVVDNAGFFAIDDLHAVGESELYDRLLKEFPEWIKSAKAKAII
jgi:stress response protein SCP2